MSRSINQEETAMQHLNGMELVALSIEFEQSRARKEFIAYLKEEYMEVAIVVLGLLLAFDYLVKLF